MSGIHVFSTAFHAQDFDESGVIEVGCRSGRYFSGVILRREAGNIILSVSGGRVAVINITEIDSIVYTPTKVNKEFQP